MFWVNYFNILTSEYFPEEFYNSKLRSMCSFRNVKYHTPDKHKASDFFLSIAFPIRERRWIQGSSKTANNKYVHKFVLKFHSQAH
jgi:hypothetical protein